MTKTKALLITILTPLFIFTHAEAVAQQFESPPTVSARSILGADAQGSNYQIDEAVRSDGFVRIFTLVTKYGRFQVEGRDLLKERLREMAALATLEQTDKSKAYTDAAAKAAKSPVTFAKNLVNDPGGTMDQTVSGVGAFFNRVTSGVKNVGKDRDDVTDSALGVSSAKRQIAVRLGVDPYTDFKPLADALNEMARVTALGDLSISGVFMVIPGGAGMAVSYSRTGQSVGEMVRDKTPAELREINRARLAEMKVPSANINAFLDNKFFTPSDQTIIVAALTQMNGVNNRQAFVVRASQVTDRALAYFQRRRAELLADHHRRVEPIVEFINAGWVPLNRTRGSRTLLLFPMDGLAWTKATSDVVVSIDHELRQRNLAGSVEVRISGMATPVVRDNLRRMKWNLVENIDP